MSDRQHPDSIRALIGEAAGEGPGGMERVAKVIHTRSRQRNLSVDDVVRQPKQFSAMDRPDLDAFILKQSKQVVQQAYEAMQRAGDEVGSGKSWATNYVTKQLYESPTRPAWVGKMKVVDRYGNHVFMNEP